MMTTMLACVAALTSALVAAPTSRPIAYTSFKEKSAYYHMVVADLKSGRVEARTIHSPRLTSAWSLVAQAQPSVAITGTFFGPRGGYPVADVLVDGELVANGRRGSAVAIDWWGGVHLFDTGFGRRVNWNDYRWALRGGVRLVSRGKVRPNPKAQKFRDPRIWGRAARTAVGLDRNGKLVFVATKNRVTLSELGRAMTRRGVREAISFDGGGSTLLYYRGQMVIGTSRRLSNLLALTERPIP